MDLLTRKKQVRRSGSIPKRRKNVLEVHGNNWGEIRWNQVNGGRVENGWGCHRGSRKPRTMEIKWLMRLDNQRGHQRSKGRSRWQEGRPGGKGKY